MATAAYFHIFTLWAKRGNCLLGSLTKPDFCCVISLSLIPYLTSGQLHDVVIYTFQSMEIMFIERRQVLDFLDLLLREYLSDKHRRLPLVLVLIWWIEISQY